MSNEIQFDFGQTGLPTSGATSPYAYVRTQAGLYVYANGATIEAYNAANWANYRITLTESGTTGVYFGTFPVVAAGFYLLGFRQQGGVTAVPSPVTDVRVGVGEMTWSGTAEVPTPTTAEVADKILGRSLAGGADSATRNVANALRASRNKVAFDVPAVGQFTVYAEDDTTSAWTGTYTSSSAANPVTVLDPG